MELRISKKKEYSCFRFNDQPLGLHLEAVKRRVRRLVVRRTKTVIVELKGTELAAYFDGTKYHFKGKPIESDVDLVDEMAQRAANKPIGILKTKLNQIL